MAGLLGFPQSHSVSGEPPGLPFLDCLVADTTGPQPGDLPGSSLSRSPLAARESRSATSWRYESSVDSRSARRATAAS